MVQEQLELVQLRVRVLVQQDLVELLVALVV